LHGGHTGLREGRLLDICSSRFRQATPTGRLLNWH